MVVGLGALAWLWRHPTVFPESGAWTLSQSSWTPHNTYYAGMTFPVDHVDGQVDIDDVQANVVTNTAGAQVEVFICNIIRGAGIGSVGEDDVDRYCSNLSPAADTTMSLNRQPPQQLIVAVTPAKPGVVTIRGLDVTYGSNWQRGTQRTGGNLTVHVIAAQ